MDITKLKRNAKVVRASLKTVGNSIFATLPTKIYIPARFNERNLAHVGAETYITGIYAICINDIDYAVSIVNSMIQIDPTSYSIVQINEEDYYEFYFEPGSKIIVNDELVQRDVLTYQIYDEFISKGRIPWYINYLDLGRIFDTAKKYANANVGQQREVTELIVSLISRDPDNRVKYYRQCVKSMDDLVKNPPAFVPLKSVIYAATNTLNKIAGSYMNDGIISALVSPSSREERIEGILKS